MATLLEKLYKLDPNEIVYLGTREGTNWIRIDTAEFLIEHIEELNYTMKNDIYNTFNNALRYVEETPYRIVETMDKLKAEDDESKIRELKKTLDGYCSRFSTSYPRSKKLRNQLDNWVHVADRKVLEVYTHETDVIGTCIIIKGIESGKVWSVEEAIKLGKAYDLIPPRRWKEEVINGY